MLNKLKPIICLFTRPQNMPFYAVARGRNVGIFEEWFMCDNSVRCFSGAKYKKFNDINSAKEFLVQNGAKIEKVHEIVDSSSDNNNSESKQLNSKEFWPDNADFESEDEDLFLAASAEVEGIPIKKSNKRKLNEPIKTLKKNKNDENMLWEPVGMKKFGNFQFPIDDDGYVMCFTDGSCENNGKKNPSAGLGVYFSDNHPMNTARPVTGRATNNVGEIQASIYAIKIAKDIGIKKMCICTDSEFLINAISIWLKSWKKRGWITKSGGPVKNKDEFKELDDLLLKNDIEIKWRHVRGHQGIEGNEKADRLAREGAQQYKKLHNVK